MTPSSGNTMRLALFTFLIMWVAGCSTSERVAVDAIRNPDAPPLHGLVMQLESADASDELLEAHVGDVIERMLVEQGLRTQADDGDPDILVRWHLAVGEPQTKDVSWTEPMYFHGRAHGWPSWEQDCRHRRHHQSPTSYRTVRRTLTAYPHMLEVRISDAHSDDAHWRGRAQVMRGNTDLRASLPLLVAALRRHVDRDTGTTVVESVSSSDLTAAGAK